MADQVTDTITPDSRWGPDGCKKYVPDMMTYFQIMSASDAVLLAFYGLGTAVVLAAYIETVVFIRKNFGQTSAERRRRTVWLLALAPAYAVTSFIGTVIPRASVITQLTSSAFFGTCLFQLLELMMCYMGGRKRVWEVVGHDKMISPRSLPVCCCCLCLQDYKLTKENFRRNAVMVLQLSIVRPGLMFIAACLFADGSLQSDDPLDSFVVITVLNLCATMPAMYGLNQLKNIVSPHLDPVKMNGKVFVVQFTMLSTLFYDVVMTILDIMYVVDCSPTFPASARAYTIYHGLTIFTMVALSLIARKLFHHRIDATFVASIPKRNQNGDLPDVTEISVSGSQIELIENGTKPATEEKMSESF